MWFTDVRIDEDSALIRSLEILFCTISVGVGIERIVNIVRNNKGER